jgi:hypothetical protein
LWHASRCFLKELMASGDIHSDLKSLTRVWTDRTTWMVASSGVGGPSWGTSLLAIYSSSTGSGYSVSQALSSIIRGLLSSSASNLPHLVSDALLRGCVGCQPVKCVYAIPYSPPHLSFHGWPWSCLYVQSNVLRYSCRSS